jgi:insulysin
MIKTSIDERKYRVIRLANNLEVLLVSDPNTSTCAASMAVGVGSYHDNDIYGLAHFFEHMLFLVIIQLKQGSKSYPSPTIFSDHLSSYFGSTNAFTEDQKTVYYFDIAKQGYDQALMIFSRIFAEPLLDLNLMKKEIDAVNSEHEKNINQDNWRQMQLIKHLSNPNHPFSKFSTGSHKTLRSVNQTVLHKRILEFYDKYYTPSNMKLTVLGHQEIEVLQDLVTKIFSDIRKDLPKDKNVMTYGKVPSKENPFFKSNLGKIIWFKKLTSTITLDLVFNIEELITKYRTKPENYFAYFMKYEGLNSLVSLLKEKNYATKIDSDSITYSTQFSQFAISLSLTDIGLKNVREVISLAFFYINKIKENGVNNEIFNETKNINEIKFKFLEKKSRYGSYMSSLSSNMFDYDYQDIMYGDYRQNHLNQTVIMDFLNSLSVENSLIFIGSKNRLKHSLEKDLFGANPVEKTENWYGTKYMEHSFNEQILNNFPMNKTESARLSLRFKNHFITKETSSLYCDGREQCYDSSHVIIPNLFYEDKHMKIYAKVNIC